MIGFALDGRNVGRPSFDHHFGIVRLKERFVVGDPADEVGLGT